MQKPPGRPLSPLETGRRRALLTLGGALAGLACGRPALALARDRSARRLTLHNTHTLESLSVVYAEGDRYDLGALQSVNQVLRDHRNGAVHPIDTRLLDLLHEVACRADRDAEFEVISGYRSPATNAMLHERSSGVAVHSLHLEGRAIDIRLVGVDLARTRDIGLALGEGGVGYYQASAFVHLDTGRPRSWCG